MAQTVCEQCKAMVFLGEEVCSNCGAPTPEEVASFGREEGAGTHGPPPEGLDLMVQKHLSDKQWGRDRNHDDGAVLDGYQLGRHWENPAGMVGALASMRNSWSFTSPCWKRSTQSAGAPSRPARPASW